MLVLSRKQTDSIVIGPDIHVTVLSVKGGRVKLGIEAPQAMRVIRSELRPKCEVADPARVRDNPRTARARRTPARSPCDPAR